jgi:hypothetical protein
MSDRFSDLKKIPNEPAARMLAMANAKLEAELQSPGSADVSTVLRELYEGYHEVDIIRLLSVALPMREAIWWACLAGRDLVGQDAERIPATLATSEIWVLKPTEENRQATRDALDAADAEDETELCALAVSMYDGKLGPGQLAEYDAPTGGATAAVFGMNMLALGTQEEEFGRYMELLIERALNIAKGGNGQVDPATLVVRDPPLDLEDYDEEEDDDDDLDDEDEDLDDEDLFAEDDEEDDEALEDSDPDVEDAVETEDEAP